MLKKRKLEGLEISTIILTQVQDKKKKKALEFGQTAPKALITPIVQLTLMSFIM